MHAQIAQEPTERPGTKRAPGHPQCTWAPWDHPGTQRERLGTQRAAMHIESAHAHWECSSTQRALRNPKTSAVLDWHGTLDDMVSRYSLVLGHWAQILSLLIICIIAHNYYWIYFPAKKLVFFFFFFLQKKVKVVQHASNLKYAKT